MEVVVHSWQIIMNVKMFLGDAQSLSSSFVFALNPLGECHGYNRKKLPGIDNERLLFEKLGQEYR